MLPARSGGRLRGALIMRYTVLQAATIGFLAIGSPAIAQQASPSPTDTTATSAPPKGWSTSLSTVVVYLRQADGRWSASLDGNIKDPATEKIEVSLADGGLRVMTQPLPKGTKRCMTKMKNRAEFGYLDCNSAFYQAQKGDAAAGVLVRGVLSFGLLTVTEAATGTTDFAVSLDRQALDAAATEAKAVEFARASAPLFEYRSAFDAAAYSEALRDFIDRYEGQYDPESLVVKAKAMLPKMIEQEQVHERQRNQADAWRAEQLRRQAAQRQAELEVATAFQARLLPGDRVRVMRDRYTPFYGMVIELKPPLAYIQWDNVTPPMQWVRVEVLLPPR
jgi:hypothetical protein